MEENIWVGMMGLNKLVQFGVVAFLRIVGEMSDFVVKIQHSWWERASEPGLLKVGEQPGSTNYHTNSVNRKEW